MKLQPDDTFQKGDLAHYKDGKIAVIDSSALRLEGMRVRDVSLFTSEKIDHYERPELIALAEWLEDFIKQIDNPEVPHHEDKGKQYYDEGCAATQRAIAKKLSFALAVYKRMNGLE